MRRAALDTVVLPLAPLHRTRTHDTSTEYTVHLPRTSRLQSLHTASSEDCTVVFAECTDCAVPSATLTSKRTVRVLYRVRNSLANEVGPLRAVGLICICN